MDNSPKAQCYQSTRTNNNHRQSRNSNPIPHHHSLDTPIKHQKCRRTCTWDIFSYITTLRYQTFIKSFEQEQVLKARTKTIIWNSTRGQPRELVNSCLHIGLDRGLRKAKSLLHQHFGNEHKIARAYMEKARSWLSINMKDTKGLHTYTLFLRGCCNAMEDVNYMHELEIPANMRAITKTLPYQLRDKWRTVACDFQEKHNQRATFKDMMDFLERQVKIVIDPVSGDIKDTPTVSKDERNSKSQHHPRMKGSIFATTVTVTKTEKGSKEKDSLPAVKTCFLCGGGHALEICPWLKKST